MTKPSLMKSATHERGSGAWYVPSGEKSYLPVSRKAWQVHVALDRSPAMRRRRSHLVVAIVATSATVATGASVGAGGRGRDSPEVRVRLAVLPRVAEAAANSGGLPEAVAWRRTQRTPARTQRRTVWDGAADTATWIGRAGDRKRCGVTVDVINGYKRL